MLLMPKRDTAILVQDIYTALERISAYIQGMDAENFLNDQKTIDAVTRNLEMWGRRHGKWTMKRANSILTSHGPGLLD